MAKKLQVFVSSTYFDLKAERQAAVAAILKAGHIPAGMELFTSGDQSQWETIKSWIDESDVYMLILGGRYGSIEKATELSYTELEYDYAVSKGKPFFAVVIQDQALEKKVKNEGTSAIEKTNGAALQKFREKVLSNISSFFDDEKDIRLTVYESLAEFSASKNLIGWVPGNTVPDTTPLFEEIKELKEENRSLSAKVAEYIRRASIDEKKHDSFFELVQVLENTLIDVPDKLSHEKNLKLSVLRLFELSINTFSTGFNNSMSMSDYDKFLFFNVAPQLKIHGLVTYEKVAGAQYRRCTLTAKGEEFASEFVRRKIKQNESPELNGSSATDSDGPPEENTPVVEPVKKSVRVKKPKVVKVSDS